MNLELRAVSKSYGKLNVLQPTTFAVADGEFLTILGPSGCGKTTILRLIGGFTRPTSGKILFGDVDITEVPTHRRSFNTVFQDYALFPHMTVEANVGYGLRVRGRPRQVIKKRVGEALSVVGLEGFASRMPSELSGGQRQRVALARAIVCEPKVILLDEPLAALDAELRRQMQGFLKDLQRSIRTTFLFVTHDQEEAIIMSDRIVVMRSGRIEQIGPPKDLYYRPKTRFVAGFFGKSNLISGRVESADAITTPLGVIALPGIARDFAGDVTISVRPENFALSQRQCGFRVPGRIADILFGGARTEILLRPDADPASLLVAEMRTDAESSRLSKGDQAVFTVAYEDIILVDTKA